ncbi:MAG: transporter substrate-binding domain-containing protein [Spirochaetia bacterium]|nr:transporter substrate-binding domain-containing protein [Spirochaetia bacterium]
MVNRTVTRQIRKGISFESHLRRISNLAAIFYLAIWFATPASQAETTAPSALVEFANATGAIKRIRDAHRLRIGMQKDYQPFHIENPRPGFTGIDAELAQFIAHELGVSVDVVFGDPETLMLLVQQGKIDIALGGISASIERRKYVSFTQPYLVSSTAGLVARRALPRESESIDYPRIKLKSIADLGPFPTLTLGVRKGTTTEQMLRTDKIFQKFKLETYANHPDLVNSLMNGNIDVLIADRIFLRALLLRRPALKNQNIPLLDPDAADNLCMLIRQGEPEFLDYLNFLLAEATRTGILANIQRRYLETDGWLP